MKLVKKEIGKICGEENVLTSPIFNEAFDSVCHYYTPKHDYAVFALCTQTKPFSSSMKWKGIIKIFGKVADLIICSSAGIIPLEFENCYPFNSYDSHSGHEGDESLSDYSKNLFESRLKLFLDKFNWKKVVFLLDPYEGASDVVHHLPFKNVKQFPSYQVWDSVTEADFIGYSLRFCKVLNKRCMQQVEHYLGVKLSYNKDMNRTMSLFQVMKDIYINKLKENVGYSKAEIVDIIKTYGHYDKSYIYKVIEGNVLGAKDYKFYIKNNEYFVKQGKLYYKNTGNPIKGRKRLF